MAPHYPGIGKAFLKFVDRGEARVSLSVSLIRDHLGLTTLPSIKTFNDSFFQHQQLVYKLSMRYGLIAPALCRTLARNPRIGVTICERSLRKLSSMRSGKPFEEENCGNYNPRNFYPARIGETLGGKYELISKLGWGTGSTVWLARATSW